MLDHLTIQDVLQGATGRWIGPAAERNRPVTNVCTDSRTLAPGDLFFALNGERFDGHNFVLQALTQGAAAAVVSEDWCRQHKPETGGKRLWVVDDTLIAFQEAARVYRRRFDIPVVAVTGSVGKTSTKEAIYQVLSQKLCVWRNQQSFNNHVGVPTTLFGLRREHQVLLTEMGTNHPHELERLSYLAEPDIALLTNIGHAHLEFFKDLQGVLAAKMEIFSHCRPDGLAVYNADDPMLRGVQFPLRRTFAYGLHGTADLSARVLGCDQQAAYTIELLGERVRIPISGKHNIYNALAAAAVGLQFQLTPQQIKAGVESQQPVEKRMQVLSMAGILVLNDVYNANPNSCRAAMETLADIQVSSGGRRIAVLGDMLELGNESAAEHRGLAEVFKSNHLDQLYLYGEATRETLARGRSLGIAVFHFPGKEELLEALAASLRPGDKVLFKGSRGMRMETLIEGLKVRIGKTQ